MVRLMGGNLLAVKYYKLGFLQLFESIFSVIANLTILAIHQLLTLQHII